MNQLIILDELELVQTETLAGKQVRKNSDDLRRSRELLNAIKAWEARSDVLMAEIPTGTQSARGAMSNGMVIGVLSAITKPLIEVSASEAKKVAVGRSTATKQEMIDWATALYPNAPWLRRHGKKDGVFKADNEHLADAVAIAHAGIKTQEFKSALAMFRSMSGS